MKGYADFYGFVTPESEGNIQACLDSVYPSFFTKREYYVNETLQINNPNKLIYGNGTILKGIGDIDILKINAGNVTMNDMDIKTPVNHSKAAILYDSNFRIWKGLLQNIRVLGDLETVRKTGFGTKAFKIETQNIHRHAYVTHVKFMNCVAEYCAVGLDIDKHSEAAIKERTWVNTLTFDFEMDGCKEYLKMYSTDINQGKLIIQDRAVLNEDEKNLFAMTIQGTSRRTDIVYFPYDTSNKPKDPIGFFRHNGNILNTNGDKTIKVKNIYLEV